MMADFSFLRGQRRVLRRREPPGAFRVELAIDRTGRLAANCARSRTAAAVTKLLRCIYIFRDAEIRPSEGICVKFP